MTADAPGVSAALSFPEKLDAKSSAEYENITARVIDALAKQNLQPLFDVLRRDTKPEEEQTFGATAGNYGMRNTAHTSARR